MSELHQKTRHALDETRILVLGMQVLLGFEYRTFFEEGFASEPRLGQLLRLGGLFVMHAVIALLMLPAARHRLVERGFNTPAFFRFTQRTADLALLPFALVLGLDVFLVADRVGGKLVGALSGGGVAAAALAFWYGIVIFRESAPEEIEMEDTKLEQRIAEVLTEARVVLPGAQALLGFQLAMVWMKSFSELPAASKAVHLGALFAIALTTIFLMAPAAYHRIVERGRDSERFNSFASKMVVAAMVTLPLGFSADLYVVLRKMDLPGWSAVAAAAGMVAAFYALWFGFTLFLRGRQASDR